MNIDYVVWENVYWLTDNQLEAERLFTQRSMASHGKADVES